MKRIVLTQMDLELFRSDKQESINDDQSQFLN
jgi:hypothetical protein